MLKGSAEIVLTDVSTGREEVVREDNLVTNAIQDLVSMNPGGLRFLSDVNYRFKVLPLCPNAIGGVLLFPTALPEDPNNYYAPASTWPVGYSSNGVNDNGDPARGSLNLEESYATGDGYRLVFDFATSQANGEIACICLTSSEGGKGYLGSAYGTYTGITDISPLSADFADGFDWYGCVGVRGETVCSARQKSAEGIRVSTASRSNQRLALAQTLKSEGLNVADFQASFNTGAGYCTISQDGDTIYAVYSLGNSTGDASLKICEIIDGKATERIVAIPGAQISSSAYGNCCVAGGFLYAISFSKRSAYRVSLDNVADIVELPMPDDMPEFGSAYMVQPFGDGIVRGDGFVITPGGAVRRANGSFKARDGYRDRSPGERVGPYFVYCTSDKRAAGYTSYISLAVANTYLATINNLAAPVTKTADKTMKIIYTLTETP